ncbi:MAG: N-acetyl-gamma-glutamyl-phosphate reductase [Actinomycetales bacterium]
MTISAAVAGASGYAGGELLRLLAAHPLLRVTSVTAASSAGQPLVAVAPQLAATPGLADLTLAETTPEQLGGADVVFLALPHGASAEVAAALPDDTLVVDMGADFRLAEASAWERWYGGAHAGTWPYGLPELPGQREVLRDARRIAGPGCYPTAVTLALGPGLASGLLVAHDLVVVAASGTSGAGKALKPHLLGSEVMGAMSPYGVGGMHRHVPEMEQALGQWSGTQVRLSFTPTLAPMPRGILATCTARLADVGDAARTAADLRDVYTSAYKDEPFVTLLPEGQWPTTAATLGANTVCLQVAVDERAGRAIVVAAIDNLTKGTAGAAVQCANLALGLEETCGLPLVGVAP